MPNSSTEKEANAEAQAQWTKNVEKDFFEDISKIDTFTAFKPMLAHDFTKTPVTSGITQPKLDGIRMVVNTRGLYSRSNKEIVAVPHIAVELKEFIASHPTITLDGELYNHELKDDFNKITSLVRKVKPTEFEANECALLVEYHVYDMVWTDGVEPYFQTRMDFIEAQNFDLPIVTVETKTCDTQEELDELYSQYTADGYEGQMVRNNTVYENKRSKNLLKRKEFITEEFDVIEVLEGSGNWAGYAKHFVLTDGTETFKSCLLYTSPSPRDRG